jgi:hypothetical protein
LKNRFFRTQEELGDLIYLCSQSKTLLLSMDIDEQQKAFILAKIAYNYLEITERLYTFQLVKFGSFDPKQFSASYFAG